MKKLVLILTIILSFTYIQAQQEFSPYWKVADYDKSVEEVTEIVTNAITSGGYNIIGQYNPANDNNLKVICFTDDELSNYSLTFEDRGALASVIKAALVKKDGKVTLSILNPIYMFYAYWGPQMKDGQGKKFEELSEKAVGIFTGLGKLEPFGGELDKDDLKKYHYKVMMPYFDDPDDLEEFDSFEAGLNIIRKNLNSGKGNTAKVFEQVFEEDKVAVFGVGLLNSEDGEEHFLPIIGEDHIANLPYEIILQGNEATMLAGKYRIALYWPELTMGTFMKIMSTPGDIEDTMEALCEE